MFFKWHTFSAVVTLCCIAFKLQIPMRTKTNTVCNSVGCTMLGMWNYKLIVSSQLTTHNRNSKLDDDTTPNRRMRQQNENVDRKCTFPTLTAQKSILCIYIYISTFCMYGQGCMLFCLSLIDLLYSHLQILNARDFNMCSHFIFFCR